MALTPAEKQKAYRDRQRERLLQVSNVTEVDKIADDFVNSLELDKYDSSARKQLVVHLILNLYPEMSEFFLLAAAGNVTKQTNK